jgi:hypothetical protein
MIQKKGGEGGKVTPSHSKQVLEGLDSQHHSLAAVLLEMRDGTHCTIGFVEVL